MFEMQLPEINRPLGKNVGLSRKNNDISVAGIYPMNSKITQIYMHILIFIRLVRWDINYIHVSHSYAFRSLF